MFTVSQLAKQYQVSRSTLLYYERKGLLQPACRSDNGYRWYGEKQLKRLEAILAYRSYGIPVNSIQSLLSRDNDRTQGQILQQQFKTLEQEIQKLRQQQKAIVLLLNQPELMAQPKLSKQRWVDIMQAAGMSEKDMHHWHQQFESMEPKGHQEFLESLDIQPEEIARIRQWSSHP